MALSWELILPKTYFAVIIVPMERLLLDYYYHEKKLLEIKTPFGYWRIDKERNTLTFIKKSSGRRSRSSLEQIREAQSVFQNFCTLIDLYEAPQQYCVSFSFPNRFRLCTSRYLWDIRTHYQLGLENFTGATLSIKPHWADQDEIPWSKLSNTCLQAELELLVEAFQKRSTETRKAFRKFG